MRQCNSNDLKRNDFSPIEKIMRAHAGADPPPVWGFCPRQRASEVRHQRRGSDDEHDEHGAGEPLEPQPPAHERVAR
jgi:hypothetical protein